MEQNGNLGQSKAAEISRTAGALVLGIGVGAWNASWLNTYVIPLVLLGALSQSWGMHTKSRLENPPGRDPTVWETVLMWSCWALLFALGISIYLSVPLKF